MKPSGRQIQKVVKNLFIWEGEQEMSQGRKKGRKKYLKTKKYILKEKWQQNFCKYWKEKRKDTGEVKKRWRQGKQEKEKRYIIYVSTSFMINVIIMCRY